MQSKRDPERILIITLSNIGDVFLTAPVVNTIRKTYPSAEVSLLVGQRAKEIFENDPRLQDVFAYDKKESLREKWRFVLFLRKKKFDLVVDLRHTLFPLLLGSPSHTPLFSKAPRHLLHRIDHHLWKVERLGIPAKDWRDDILRIHPDSIERIKKRLAPFRLRLEDPFILLSPGSKSSLKRWKASSFAALSDRLYKEKRIPAVFIGEEDDQSFMDRIIASLHEPFHSLVGQTSLSELTALIRASILLVTNDNASLHIASLLGTPTVALFGPTDPQKYGPRAKRHRVVRKDLFCSPCEKARCPYHHECMEELLPEEVYQACCELLI